MPSSPLTFSPNRFDSIYDIRFVRCTTDHELPQLLLLLSCQPTSDDCLSLGTTISRVRRGPCAIITSPVCLVSLVLAPCTITSPSFTQTAEGWRTHTLITTVSILQPRPKRAFVNNESYIHPFSNISISPITLYSLFT